jgi:integrase
MAPNLKPNTLKQYQVAARKLKPILVEFSPEQVRQRDVAAIRIHFSQTPAMGNRVLSFLRSVFAYAVEWQLVETNPCLGIRRHKESQRDRLVTAREFHAIRDAAKHRAIPVILDLCYLTGQRIGDILAIKNSDITSSGIEFAQEKTGNKVIVDMTDDMRAVIAEARRIHPPHERAEVLLYTRGFKRYSYATIKDAFNRARTAAGVTNVTIHDLRAMSGTDAEAQGLDPTLLLAHTTSQQTKRYLRGRKAKRAHGPKMVPDDR